MASALIRIGPEDNPFGDLELMTYEATFVVTQSRTSTGATTPVATVTLRATDFSYVDNPAYPVVPPVNP